MDTNGVYGHACNFSYCFDWFWCFILGVSVLVQMGLVLVDIGFFDSLGATVFSLVLMGLAFWNFFFLGSLGLVRLFGSFDRAGLLIVLIQHS